ncbi:MAG: AAA family ATPase [Herpetosiphonaceae bacterium]|nr:AAA family ATPase [Herpetosiphonaceae bacterium]
MCTDPPLADILGQFMKDRRSSLRGLAREADVPAQTIHHWLRGRVKHPHTFDQLLKVAAALRLSKSEATQLLHSAGHKSIDELLAQATSPAELALLKPWRITTPHNLPSEVTSFVGRGALLDALVRLLEKARLVTLTGRGGSGKTRLALQIATKLLPSFPDGIFFVPLAPLSDPELVIPAIAQSLGVTTSGGLSLSERLQDYLRHKQILLVLDNFEKVMAAGPTVAQLLPPAAGLKLLVTSQVPLQLYAEHIFAVPSLEVPAAKTALTLKELACNEAVRLFLDRAQAAGADIALTEANLTAIVALCRQLEGLPLSIELAAARVPLILLPLMVEQMHARLDLLVHGALDLPERHQSLRGTLDWSYNLLDQAEQLLFRRLAIFVGGCSLDAAAAVCGGMPVRAGLTSLVQKSLVQQVTGMHGTPRFMLLETIREYAWEHLEASRELDLIRQHHAHFYLAFAEAAAPGLRDSWQTRWLDRLDQDHDNLRAVLQRATATADAETAIRIGAAIWPFWHVRGHWSEGRQQLEAALALPGSTSERIRAEALTGAATLALVQYDRTRAHSLFKQSYELSMKMDDRHGVAEATYNLGWVAQSERDHARAIDLYQESFEQFHTLVHQPGMLVSLVGLTWTTMFEGQLDQARSYGEAGVALGRELGDKGAIASILNVLGLVSLYQGDYTRASTYYAGGLALYRALHHSGGISAILMNQGFVALFEGRYHEAAVLYRESLSIGCDLHDQLVINYTLDGLGGVAGALGQPVRAARLGGAAEALRERIGTPIPEAEQANHDAIVATIRAQLDEHTWTAAWSAGRALPLADAIAEALSEVK